MSSDEEWENESESKEDSVLVSSPTKEFYTPMYWNDLISGEISLFEILDSPKTSENDHLDIISSNSSDDNRHSDIKIVGLRRNSKPEQKFSFPTQVKAHVTQTSDVEKEVKHTASNNEVISTHLIVQRRQPPGLPAQQCTLVPSDANELQKLYENDSFFGMHRYVFGSA